MQLTIDVLPAPFGPMIENSSPSRTAKLTSLKAQTPRNRSVTCRASRIGGGIATPDMVAATCIFFLPYWRSDARLQRQNRDAKYETTAPLVQGVGIVRSQVSRRN